MREETVNRRITNAIEEIEIESLRRYLKEIIRFERSKMDRDQPYYKKTFQELTANYAPDDPDELEGYDAGNLTTDVIGSQDLDRASERDGPIQIHEIRLKNWRQYGGEQSIDLSAVDNRLINVIEGQNGAGKTNLLNAVTLCFYGKQIQERSSNTDLSGHPFVTLSRIEDAEVGTSVQGFIEIILGMSEPEYLFRREFETKKLENGEYQDSFNDLELRRKDEGEWKPKDNPASYLNQVLPARVSEYFLFDGEDLDGFFDVGYPQRVEEAIFDVSHLELLNRAIQHFGKIRRDLEREASDIGGEVGEIRSELESIEAELKERQDEIQSIEETIVDTKNNISDINDRLMDVSDSNVQQRVERIEEQRKRVSDLEDQLETNKSEIKDILINIGPTLYAAEPLLEALDNLEAIAKAESIPPKIQRRFISEIIERGVCICGRPIEEHSDEETHLEELRESVFDVSEAQLEDSSTIPTIFETALEQVELLIDKRRQAVQIEDEIDELKRNIKNTQHELEAYEIPDVDIEALENNRKELESELEQLHERRARLQVDIEELEQKRDKVNEDLKEELKKQETHKEILANLSLINLGEECFHRIRDGILQDIRSRTESNISEYFNQLIWKDEEYEIMLTRDYTLQVLDEFGENKIGSLSAGETQVLALSFMAALSQISGFGAPVVIDTPLGRISSTPKRFIAENLPDYLSNTQVTFLMTDEEYTDEVRDIMADSVGREYRLVYENNETTVVERDELPEVNI